jgi:hypothetical protein
LDEKRTLGSRRERYDSLDRKMDRYRGGMPFHSVDPDLEWRDEGGRRHQIELAHIGRACPGQPVQVAVKDKDCIGYFESEKQAQRFFLKHGGPKRDPHGLDSDGDGRACEEFDY